MNERILQFIEYLGISVSEFERSCNLSNGAVSKMGDNTRRATLNKICYIYPQLNIDWLLTGKGDMINIFYVGDLKDRIIEYCKYKNIGIANFAAQAGLPNDFFNDIQTEIHISKIKKILYYHSDLNRNWLLTGEGDMLNNNEQTFAIQNTTNEPAKNDLSDYETWLLPQTAHGGSLTNIPADGMFLQNCEKIVSPIKGVDFAISVYGESMSPEYPSGSRVLIKKINHNAYIDWGKAYVIDTCNGVILKEVLKCQQEGFITCHSINPDPKFADFDLSLNDVYGIYRVLMCLSAK